MSDEVKIAARRVLAAFTGGPTVRSYSGEEADALAKLAEVLTEIPPRESARCALKSVDGIYHLDCPNCGETLGRTSSKVDAESLWARFNQPNTHICYRPYCLRGCRELRRMRLVGPLLWRCDKCGAEHDERKRKP